MNKATLPDYNHFKMESNISLDKPKLGMPDYTTIRWPPARESRVLYPIYLNKRGAKLPEIPKKKDNFTSPIPNQNRKDRSRMR